MNKAAQVEMNLIVILIKQNQSMMKNNHRIKNKLMKIWKNKKRKDNNL